MGLFRFRIFKKKGFPAISYSRYEFNETAFEEYDPTPYDGGFDIAITYGNPLPPSDAICYPLSVSDLNSSSLDGFSYGSVPSPYGNEPVDYGRPRNGGELTQPKREEIPSYDGNGNLPNGSNDVLDHQGECNFSYGYGNDGIFNGYNGYGGGYGKPADPYQGEKRGYGYGIPDPEPTYDYHPGYGMDEQGYGTPEPQCSYGDHGKDEDTYMDPFGSWLGLSQDFEKSYGHQDDTNEQCYGNLLKGTADYLFGYSYQYGEKRDESHNYANLAYSYERHRREQPYYRTVERDEPTWFQKSSYYDGYLEEVHPQSQYLSSLPLLCSGETRDESHNYENLTYSYERHRPEQAYYETVEYNEPTWFLKPSYYDGYQEEVHLQSQYVSSLPLLCSGETRDESHNYANLAYGCEMHRPEQAYYGMAESNEPTWFQKPSYYDGYQEGVHPKSQYVSSLPLRCSGETMDESHNYANLAYGYEMHRPEQTYYGTVESNEPTWFQKPSYYDGYQEGVHPKSQYSPNLQDWLSSC